MAASVAACSSVMACRRWRMTSKVMGSTGAATVSKDDAMLSPPPRVTQRNACQDVAPILRRAPRPGQARILAPVARVERVARAPTPGPRWPEAQHEIPVVADAAFCRLKWVLFVD